MTAKKIKPSDRANIAQSIIKSLKKRYKHHHKPFASLLENLIFSICLENTCYTQAEASFNYIRTHFHDWNEIRVSSLSELVLAFPDDALAGERSRRIVEILQYSFDQFYTFELDPLKKKTPEQLEKINSKFSSFSPFVKSTLLHLLLGSHVVPVDQCTHNICRFTGLVDYHSTIEQASELLKSVFRKAETQEFLDYLRYFGTEKEIHKHVDAALLSKLAEDEIVDNAVDRITNILNGHFEKKYESKYPSKPAPAKPASKADKKSSLKPASKEAEKAKEKGKGKSKEPVPPPKKQAKAVEVKKVPKKPASPAKKSPPAKSPPAKKKK